MPQINAAINRRKNFTAENAKSAENRKNNFLAISALSAVNDRFERKSFLFLKNEFITNRNLF